jgi:hypothetical protein
MAVNTATFQKVAVLKVGCPWKIGEPCSEQTPTYDTPATAAKPATSGMLAIARIPAYASNRRICVEKLKVAGNEARNMAVNAAVIKKI